MTSEKKKFTYPAADRNKEPILQVLKQYIDAEACDQKLLEISSGSGQHVAHFAPHFPKLAFYPSEYDQRLLGSIEVYTEGMSNVRPPCRIDVSEDHEQWPEKFPESSFDYVYNCNLFHVSPWKCSVGVFRNAGKLLKADGLLITYGALAIDGVIAPESNVTFDENIRSQDPEWGIRDLADLSKVAKEHGIELQKVIDMPANNKIVIWKKVVE
ncbi:hypothetical protein TKK_0019314 [Trichogramma kaykai]|uniref:Methyltransferase type 11 domain-containing protein n=1 Tax=Trichogramma kaykai TaxID=54128 RepID=A0ABD2VSZ8_9HYME